MTTEQSDFQNLCATESIIPVVRELFYDFETPVGIFNRIADKNQGSFLLESAVSGIWSEWSFVGVSSFGQLSGKGDTSSWLPISLSEEEAFGAGGIGNKNPLEALEMLYSRWQGSPLQQLPPLNGGLVGYLGWDVIHLLENVARPAENFPTIPDVFMNFVSELIAVNHKTGTILLITNILVDQTQTAKHLWEQSQTQLDQLQKQLFLPLVPRVQLLPEKTEITAESNFSEKQFVHAVSETMERIHNGDAFQVVLSQRFSQDFVGEAIDVYRILRATNPSPYMYLLNCVDTAGELFQVVGSSPEALIKVTDRTVVSHPIAGSRPRGKTVAEDEQLEQELLADQKEKSEHVMLVDLARNDLSKVCDPASIHVTEYMEILRFSHIMHIGSTVIGTLKPKETAVSALLAAFPAGTLSGAPKPMALSIIAEKEQSTRGVYGGVVGYFGLSGDADLAIAIRTATIHDKVATVQAGAGIVADSVPLSEFQETVNKAMAPMRAIATANSVTNIVLEEAQE